VSSWNWSSKRSSVADQYIQQGGEFVSPPSLFVEKMKSIRVVLFDWDGVFNDGFKRGEEGSIFSEVDAMGTNLLRYALWRANGAVPVSAIMTGENNPSAVLFAKRENFTAVFTGTKNKGKAFQLFCDQYKCTPSQVLFFGDDVLDLEVARQCGVRIVIGRKSGVLIKQASEQFSRAGIDHGIIQGSNTFGTHKLCIVASIQTVARRGLPPSDLIVIDEAHGVPGSKDYLKLLYRNNNVVTVGLSATPFSRGMGKKHAELNDEPLFQSLVVTATIQKR
jgi:3-deoxy-D-manno-octulosonate 8-phosphate phosphatase (KDO 8-P phosphatase)